MRKSIFIPILITGIIILLGFLIVPQFYREEILSEFCRRNYVEMEKTISKMQSENKANSQYGLMQIKSVGDGCYEVYFDGFILIGISELYYTKDGMPRGDLTNLEEPALLTKQGEWWCWNRNGNHGKSREIEDGWFYNEAHY